MVRRGCALGLSELLNRSRKEGGDETLYQCFNRSIKRWVGRQKQKGPKASLPPLAPRIREIKSTAEVRKSDGHDISSLAYETPVLAGVWTNGSRRNRKRHDRFLMIPLASGAPETGLNMFETT